MHSVAIQCTVKEEALQRTEKNFNFSCLAIKCEFYFRPPSLEQFCSYLRSCLLGYGSHFAPNKT